MPSIVVIGSVNLDIVATAPCLPAAGETVTDAVLALLREGDVDLSGVVAVDDAATGVALITVAASGENQIVVAPGANRRLASETLQVPAADALIGEVLAPLDAVARAVVGFEGFTCVNLAPAKEVDEQCCGALT